MATQIIRPAGAGHETAWVLAACALVVVLVAAFIGARTAAPPAVALATHEVDARRDLTPAEQGLYADLRIAADEISHDNPLSIEDLAELGIAPFMADASHVRRGEHRWQRLETGSHVGYLGVSGELAVAGALLLLVETHSAGAHAAHATTEPHIWLHRGQSVTPPDQLDADSLVRGGWRQIVAQFDAGVTRERRTGQTQ